MVQKYQNLAPKIIDLRKSLGDRTQEKEEKPKKEQNVKKERPKKD